MDEALWARRPEWAESAPLTLAAADGRLCTHLVVVVAHPDDETLVVGGLIHDAAAAGVAVTVVVLTDGEASHPDSPTHSPSDLRRLRRAEVAEALATLAPHARLVRPALPDGGLMRNFHEIVGLVGGVLDETATDGALVVSTWRFDGHPDHEAVGAAVAQVCAERGVRHLEAPLWLWAWQDAAAVPWSELLLHPLSRSTRVVKREALAAHTSQVGPLSAAPGDEALLSAEVLAHFARPWESFVERGAASFDEMYAAGDDPWGFDSSWYEERKRALTLASLPERRLGRVLEIGPGTGLLTVALAERADEVLAIDVSAQALERVEDRLRSAGLADHVELRRGHVAYDWPEGEFDIILVSEVGYFLSSSECDVLLASARDHLSASGTLCLVHWLHPIEGWPLDGHAVHDRALKLSGLERVVQHVETDLRIDVLRRPGLPSVAQAEGRC